MDEKIINYIYDNLPKKRALFLGLFLLIIIFSSLDSFFEKLFHNTERQFIVYIFGLLFWLLYWIYQKYGLPVNKKNYVGIVVSINAENDKQKIRIKNDFIGQLNKLIAANSLGQTINIILLNDHKSKMVYDIFYHHSISKNNSKKNKHWNRIIKSMKSHFFIYGNIKERQDGENKYFLDLDALVLHSPVDILIRKEIQQDFLSVWYKQISFKEKIEFKGFEFTASSIFVAVEYVVGIAALVSGGVRLALKLHSNLNNDHFFNQFNPIPPNLKHVKDKLRVLLTEENYLVARTYYTNNDIDEAKKYVQRSLTFQQNYGALLLRAIIEFANEQNPKKALGTIYEAKKLAGSDGAWRYSEAFLLLQLERYEEALKVYRAITEYSYEGEEITLSEVYTFNKNLLLTNPQNSLSYFIIGYLKYKKDSNYPDSYIYFQDFLNKSDKKKYDYLKQKVSLYIAELEQKMKIPFHP